MLTTATTASGGIRMEGSTGMDVTSQGSPSSDGTSALMGSEYITRYSALYPLT